MDPIKCHVLRIKAKKVMFSGTKIVKKKLTLHKIFKMADKALDLIINYFKRH